MRPSEQTKWLRVVGPLILTAIVVIYLTMTNDASRSEWAFITVWAIMAIVIASVDVASAYLGKIVQGIPTAIRSLMLGVVVGAALVAAVDNFGSSQWWWPLWWAGLYGLTQRPRLSRRRAGDGQSDRSEVHTRYGAA